MPGAAMKAVIRRLRQIERRLAPQIDAESDESLRLAILLRERRRHRLEASGEPFEELPPLEASLAPGRRLSYAETLRQARQCAYERNPRVAGSAHIATDISP